MRKKVLLMIILLIPAFDLFARTSQTIVPEKTVVDPHMTGKNKRKEAQPLDADERARIGARCEIHNQTMKLGIARINYGMPVYDKAFMNAEKTSFPNSNLSVLGGCVITDNSPTHAEVVYCDACRKAEKVWRKEHRDR
ncbi:MAG: hypothetical protein AB1757_28460 [Acidobacteriota bacterium]